ncbi:MAG: hypothetical protein DDT31_01826 [Syntrophomonadaceae bacterium]|nr:hypothetical protein [Bacillota bacterium]
MRALTITNKKVGTGVLLKLAEEIPGAWTGIRIAAMILILEGYKSSFVAGLFGISRWSVVKWIRRINVHGVAGLLEGQRPGRPSSLNVEIRESLKCAVKKNPTDYGINRRRWDGKVVSEYLRKVHGVSIKIRQSQRWLSELGFSLQRPLHKYAQALGDDVKKLKAAVKKNS